MYAYSSNWIIFLPIAFSLFFALRLNQGSRDDAQSSIPVLIVRSAIFLMFLFAFFSLGSRSSFLSIGWGLMLIALGFIFWWKGRRLDRSAMMLSVMNTHRRDQQLILAAAFYHANTGFVRRRSRALHRFLSNGYPWAQSLELSGISKSAYARLACRLQSRFEQQRPDHKPDVQGPMHVEQEIERSLGRLMIFSWVIFLIPVLAFFMKFIVPTFFEMFEEFGLELPPLMKLVIAVSDVMASLGPNILLLMLHVGFFAFLLGAIALWLFPGLSRLPGVRWFFKDYYENLGFLALARSSEVEPNLINACQTTADLVPIDFIASRYRKLASLLGGGMKATDAFRKAGLMGKREVAALAFGLESQNPIWGLGQLASFKTERMLRKYSMIMQAAIVFTTVFLGLIVGAFAVGVLQSLSVMILEMSNY
jgi:hypothetical protein